MNGLLRTAQLAIVACLVSCGPAATPHDSRPKRAAAPEAWSPLTWEERHDVMTFVVLPNMGRLFQEFRETEYPDLTCDSCHGKDKLVSGILRLGSDSFLCARRGRARRLETQGSRRAVGSPGRRRPLPRVSDRSRRGARTSDPCSCRHVSSQRLRVYAFDGGLAFG